jgi:tetratricopeptide (TPR) repeat protein
MMQNLRVKNRSGHVRSILLYLLLWAVGFAPTADSRAIGAVSRAQATEERRTFDTYPFSLPNRIPLLASDSRLYPYHRFEGYAHEPESREWKVVKLENSWIEVWVLPEVGGKVWGARVKKTGHEFIYRNEVMKFRNIALRGPWVSGGIEFNFGLLGHTPATATPVDWLTRQNDDGSASVFVGAMDLPSRTRWRVEIRLPADRACFETRVRWENPTVMEQSYYNWMTAAAFARDDLVLSVPGNAYLGHPGDLHPWPEDERGRHLNVYDQNRFGENRSYHVVGSYQDFFGGYYGDDDYGFGHWSPYGDMPGQKIWLWALSRQGGIWEDLLTDSDGQYVEFQAGRLLVQYSAAKDATPINDVGFGPGTTDEWTEAWFPVEGLGGLSAGSPYGALHVERSGQQVRIRTHAFSRTTAQIRIHSDTELLREEEQQLEVLEPHEMVVDLPEGTKHFSVEMPGLGLMYSSDPRAYSLSRPFTTPYQALDELSGVAKSLRQASELVQRRRLKDARKLFATVLEAEPWNREALLGLAQLEYRRGFIDRGLSHVNRALQLDAYDPQANFIAGTLYRALDCNLDAAEAFGWAARSMTYRHVACLQLAELASVSADYANSKRHALRALQYDARSSGPRRMLALIARVEGDLTEADYWLHELAELDPLDHFVSAERFLSSGQSDAPSPEWSQFLGGLTGEYPEQEVVELVLDYLRFGRAEDAIRLLRQWLDKTEHPVLRAYYAVLSGDVLTRAADPAFAFPYRAETLPVLRKAVRLSGEHESWNYLLALNLWALDRAPEAAEILNSLGDEPDYAPFYTARAALIGQLAGDGHQVHDIEADLRRGVALDSSDRNLRIPLICFLQEAGRHEDALHATSEARRAFPDDFVLELLETISLVKTEQNLKAIEILKHVRVLPSEHSSQARGLFVQAHLHQGMEALENGRIPEAIEHFEISMTWPENLGQGRPYDPEERLPRYLLGIAQLKLGNASKAKCEFEAVVAATSADAFKTGQKGRFDVLAVAALEALGRSDEAGALGEPFHEFMQGNAEPSDVQGRLLNRAINQPRPQP